MAVLTDINYHSFIRGSGDLPRRFVISLSGTFPHGAVLLLVAVMQLCCFPAVALEGNYLIVITKSTRELVVMQEDRVIKKYMIAYGKGHGLTKRQIGDYNTPTGSYRIVKFKPDSKFFFFMQLDYPNLLDAWYGYKDNIISSTDFRDIAAAFKNHQAPPQDTRLGGYIGIHGLGEVNADALKIHQTGNWTDGCIALKNEEINELRRYVSIGTSIIIRP
jgi:murein L,D-transpeptidase YafK